MPEITKPVALITGAARGIGLGCASALARAGFRVALCDLDGDTLHKAAAELDGLALPADVADLGQQQSLIQATVGHFGRLDCLVNNAGVGVLQRGDLLDVSVESFDRCMRVNARAMFFLSQAVARHMIHQGPIGAQHRSIINITSSNAVAVSISRGEYCVSKAASSMTTRLFALRLAEAGIGVYEVRPGVIETDMTLPVKDHYDALIAEGLVPVGRWGFPADVAATVTAMAEGRLPYTVGLAVPVDGGMTIPRF